MLRNIDGIGEQSVKGHDRTQCWKQRKNQIKRDPSRDERDPVTGHFVYDTPKHVIKSLWRDVLGNLGATAAALVCIFTQIERVVLPGVQSSPA
ncbi:hypothetical protein D9M68_771620 [compost metagenome]